MMFDMKANLIRPGVSECVKANLNKEISGRIARLGAPDLRYATVNQQLANEHGDIIFWPNDHLLVRCTYFEQGVTVKIQDPAVLVLIRCSRLTYLSPRTQHFYCVQNLICVNQSSVFRAHPDAVLDGRNLKGVHVWHVPTRTDPLGGWDDMAGNASATNRGGAFLARAGGSSTAARKAAPISYPLCESLSRRGAEVYSRQVCLLPHCLNWNTTQQAPSESCRKPLYLVAPFPCLPLRVVQRFLDGNAYQLVIAPAQRATPVPYTPSLTLPPMIASHLSLASPSTRAACPHWNRRS
jgi:hypothetical protein